MTIPFYRSPMTVASASLRLIQAAAVNRGSVWQALKEKAIRVEDSVLEFADGSKLRFVPQNSSYLAT